MARNETIRVVVRVRPLNEKEQLEGKISCLYTDEEQNSIVLDTKPYPKTFTFDFLAGQDFTQQEIFQEVGQSIVTSCMAGYNGTIFAYGQTGAGKTYTIHGPSLSSIQDRGLVPRCLDFLFQSIDKAIISDNLEFLVKCSYLEIYQEQLRDLLTQKQSKLQVREDITKGVYVEFLKERAVNNSKGALQLLNKGNINRHTASTAMNEESSRSHSIFTLSIYSKLRKQELVNIKTSRLHLVDLAGSERQKQTSGEGTRLKEASNINKSLSALGNVINALVDISEGKNRFVHFRDSKLTFLLKDSLGGNSKTCMIACVSCSSFSFNDTLSTLKFAQRAKLIKTVAVINEDVSGGLEALKEEVKRLRIELENAQMTCQNCSENVDNQQFYLNDMLHQSQNLLAKEQQIRIQQEQNFQEQIQQMQQVIQSFETQNELYHQKQYNDKMLLKIKQQQINQLKQTKNYTNQDYQQEVDLLLQENQVLQQADTDKVSLKIPNFKDEKDQNNLEQEREQYLQELNQHLEKSLQERERLVSQLKDQQHIIGQMELSMINCDEEEFNSRKSSLIPIFQQSPSFL